MNYQTIAGLSPARLQFITNRFWSKVKTGAAGDCWEWQGHLDDSGYGRVRINNRRQKANRVCYELTYGPIPPGLYVCHSCDNRLCVNPVHLSLGTHADNMREKIERGRLPDQKGEKSSRARLNKSAVQEIRRKYIPYKYGCKRLASEYGTTYQNIWRIVTGKTW